MKTGAEIMAEAYESFDQWCKNLPEEDQSLSTLELINRYYAEWLNKQKVSNVFEKVSNA